MTIRSRLWWYELDNNYDSDSDIEYDNYEGSHANCDDKLALLATIGALAPRRACVPRLCAAPRSRRAWCACVPHSVGARCVELIK